MRRVAGRLRGGLRRFGAHHGRALRFRGTPQLRLCLLDSLREAQLGLARSSLLYRGGRRQRLYLPAEQGGAVQGGLRV